MFRARRVIIEYVKCFTPSKSSDEVRGAPVVPYDNGLPVVAVKSDVFPSNLII